MEVTKREILVSIAIFFIMLGLGFILSQNISSHTEEVNEEYRKALKVEDLETYDYAKEIGVDHCFTVFQVDAITPQTLPELKKDYLYIERIYEVETEKTRIVKEEHTDSDGNKYTTERVETYWEWDVEHRDRYESPTVSFNGREYPKNQFSGYDPEYLDTSNSDLFDLDALDEKWNAKTRGRYAYISTHKRYSYKVVPAHLEGSTYISLASHEIPNKVSLHRDTSVENLYQASLSSATFWIVLFWIIWIMVTGGLIFGYCYLDNDYLEDDNGESLHRNRWRRW